MPRPEQGRTAQAPAKQPERRMLTRLVPQSTDFRLALKGPDLTTVQHQNGRSRRLEPPAGVASDGGRTYPSRTRSARKERKAPLARPSGSRNAHPPDRDRAGRQRIRPAKCAAVNADPRHRSTTGEAHGRTGGPCQLPRPGPPHGRSPQPVVPAGAWPRDPTRHPQRSS